MRYIVYYVGFGLLVIAVLVGSWYLADMIIPQSEIDKVEAILRKLTMYQNFTNG